jgi:hypothetical protein
MRIVRFGAGLAALMLSAHALSAQQSAPPHMGPGAPGGMMGPQNMQMMDSFNARLDTLVVRMNRATGNKKITAMADVINELVAQRKAMHQAMHQMAGPHPGMGGMMMQPGPGGMRPPVSAPDSASADTSRK